MEPPIHFLRYGSHAEQRYFEEEMHDAFDAIVFNANLVAYSAAGIAGLLAQVAKGKPFLVVPQTYVFQLDPSFLLSEKSDGTLSLKASVRKLAEAYGPTLEELAGEESLKPDDFEDERRAEQFCKQVLHFQESYLLEAAKDQDYYEMLKYIGAAEDTFKPCALVAPAFYLPARDARDWADVNDRLLRISKDIAEDLPLWGNIIIDQDCLCDDAWLVSTLEAFEDTDTSHAMLWVDQLDEHEASRALLRQMKELAARFAGKGIQLFNAYGGYFSTILSKLGLLGGVCHGPEYGESRSVIPVGGGIPVSKFYFPQFHQRLPFAQALRITQRIGALGSRKAYLQLVCSCPECETHISDPAHDFGIYGEYEETRFVRRGSVVSMAYPTPETQEHCRRHYLWNKHFEFSKSCATADRILDDLDSSIKAFGPSVTRHLRRWKRVVANPEA